MSASVLGTHIIEFEGDGRQLLRSMDQLEKVSARTAKSIERNMAVAIQSAGKTIASATQGNAGWAIGGDAMHRRRVQRDANLLRAEIRSAEKDAIEAAATTVAAMAKSSAAVRATSGEVAKMAVGWKELSHGLQGIAGRFSGVATNLGAVAVGSRLAYSELRRLGEATGIDYSEWDRIWDHVIPEYGTPFWKRFGDLELKLARIAMPGAFGPLDRFFGGDDETLKGAKFHDPSRWMGVPLDITSEERNANRDRALALLGEAASNRKKRTEEAAEADRRYADAVEKMTDAITASLPHSPTFADIAKKAPGVKGWNDAPFLQMVDPAITERTREMATTTKRILQNLGAEYKANAATLKDAYGAAIENIEGLFTDVFFDVITGKLDDLDDAFKAFFKNIAREIAALLAQKATAAIIGKAITVAGAANGGVFSGGFTPFADGGIVRNPTLGLVGEGRYPEAVVPLPDGNSIPVSMRGGSRELRQDVRIVLGTEFLQGIRAVATPTARELVAVLGRDFLLNGEMRGVVRSDI